MRFISVMWRRLIFAQTSRDLLFLHIFKPDPEKAQKAVKLPGLSVFICVKAPRIHSLQYTLCKNNGSLLARRTSIELFHSANVLCCGKTSRNALHTKKEVVHCSLRNLKWFFYTASLWKHHLSLCRRRSFHLTGLKETFFSVNNILITWRTIFPL